MKEIDRRLKVIDEVIRHMIVRVDEEQRVVERTRNERTATSGAAGASRAVCRLTSQEGETPRCVQ